MARAIHATTRSGGPLMGYRARGYLFREAMATGFIAGLYLHSARLLFGNDELRAHLLTPTVDVIFGLLLLYTAGASVAAWRLVAFRNRRQRVQHTVITLFVAISVPLHLSALFTHSTGYIDWAPWWYSAAEIPVFLIFLVIETRLRLRPDADRPQ